MTSQPLKMKKHTPVLQNEILQILAPKPGENFIDCTLGYGGHARLILEKTSPNGELLGIDQDQEAIIEAKKNLAKFGSRIQIEHTNFTELGLLIRQWPVTHIDGILIDLGASTPQLTGERGFSFRTDAPLDMRMNPQAGHRSAAHILNKFSEKEITQILFDGEERFARQIAKKIIEVRHKKPITTTKQLVDVIRIVTPPSYRYNKKLHFATNTFRALRMRVNEELENLKKVLPQAVQILSPGGRMAVISFHSLEDRIVKQYLRDNQDLEILTTKPIMASQTEITHNPSARSAKLRGAKKL